MGKRHNELHRPSEKVEVRDDSRDDSGEPTNSLTTMD